ncbi:helix-turn-helix domain-containing protein [Methylobacterium oryzihabitans]|uniref:helix-turn-helix domain-containing protein n=1 Tax=Methylobacterium oryzihabitans TaxID=2499852 RepID=UPI001FE96581|nr:XRE family transcriptional regulator [Methylobacterium oryzihabitans]
MTRKTVPRAETGEAVATVPTALPARFTMPAAEPEEGTNELGSRLRRMRLDRGWTLEDVSRRTGVARSTLSKIENGQMSPTYDVLQRITRGTGLDIVELFDTRRQTMPFGRRSVTRRDEGKIHRSPAYRYEVLATDLSQKEILPFKARVTARGLDDFEGWVRHQGEEFLCVLSGRVQVYTEFYEPVVLDQGDSIYFDSKMGHAVISVSEDDAEVVWVCTGITALK